MTEQESLASLKILAIVAKADGVIQDSERAALSDALSSHQLPGGVTVQGIIDGEADLKTEAAKITSSEARESTYSAAVALAAADGDSSPEEKKVLDQLKAAFSIPQERVNFLNRVFQEAKDTVSVTGLRQIEDPAKRASAIKEDTIKYSILSAVLGAFPVPGLAIATDIAVIGVQGKLVRDIGQYYGQPLNKEAAKTLLVAIAGGAGARIAVNNLAKFLPGFGSAFGATTSFASTWAVSKVAVQYFESGGKLEMSALGGLFKSAKKEGEKAYKENASAVDAKKKESEAKITALSQDLKDGKISKEEYEKQIAQL